MTATLLFESFTLDMPRRELRRGTELIALEPQVFDLLVFIIQSRDRVVSKDDLIEAVWGGRIVSDSTLTTRINAMRKALGDSGEEQRLIRTVPRKGIRFVGEVTEGNAIKASAPHTEAPATTFPVLSLPEKPSIAVLPFQNMSGDLEQDYFCDGMVEEIITALSRFPWLFVIARNSTFTYKGRAVDVKQVARELGVRYVVEGSVRKASGKVRITGQLIDAASGTHLWADRFDGDLADVFELQDKLAVSVVGALEPRLRSAEVERARRKPVTNLGAYDLHLRALPLYYAVTKDSLAEALDLLYRAIDMERGYAAACARAAMIYPWRSTQGWMTSREKEVAEAVRLARRAIDSDRDDSEAMYLAGATLIFFATDVDLGLNVIDRSLAMNGNCAHAWMHSGQVQTYVGDPDLAIEHLLRAQRMSPRDPMMYFILHFLACAHMSARRFDRAIEYARLSIGEHRGIGSSLRVLAACCAHLGRMDEARDAVVKSLELRPGYSLKASIATGRALLQGPHAAIFIDGMRKAGLPE